MAKTSGQSKPIEGKEIIIPNALQEAQRDADRLLATYNEIHKLGADQLKEIRKSINGNKLNSSSDLVEFKKQQLAATQVIKDRALQEKLGIEIIKKRQDLERQAIKYAAEQVKAEKAATEALKQTNTIIKQTNAEYKKLGDRVVTNSLNNRELSKTAKLVSVAHDELRAKIDKAEGAAGRFQRNVGNYPKQLKEMQRALQDLEPGTKEFNELAIKAGELKDKINDAKDATKAFASESKGTQLKNLFGQIGGDLADLNFKDAAEKARTFAQVAKSITFAEMLSGIKNLGTAFSELATTLLANPIFLIGATIAAVIGATYAYTKALEDNDEAIKSNNDFLTQSKENYDALIKAIILQRLEILKTRGVITDSEFKIKVARQDAKDADLAATKRLNDQKKKLAEQYGLNELSVLDQVLLGTGLTQGILLEKQKNYSAKVKEEEEATIKERILIREKLQGEEEKIRAEDLADLKKENEKKLEEDKKHIEKRRKLEDVDSVSKIENKNSTDKELAKIDQTADYNAIAKYEDDKAEAERREAERRQRLEDGLNFTIDTLEKINAKRNQLEENSINTQISQREKAVQIQQELSDKGQINSLAFEKEGFAKAELAREEQKKKEIKRQKEIAFFKLIAAFADKDPEKSVTKAGLEMAQAGIVAAAFYEGTENVGDALGNKGKTFKSAKDAYLGITKSGKAIRFDEEERIMNGKQNSKVGNLSNDELANLAMAYNSGLLLPKYAMNLEQKSANTTGENIANSLMVQQLFTANEQLKSLQSTIENKKESRVNWKRNGDVQVEEIENGMRKILTIVRKKPRV